MVTDSSLLTNICPESSEVLERFNICGRKEEEGAKKIKEGKEEEYFTDKKI